MMRKISDNDNITNTLKHTLKEIPLKVKLFNYAKSLRLGTSYFSDIHFSNLAKTLYKPSAYLSHSYRANFTPKTPLAIRTIQKEHLIEEILDNQWYTFPKTLLVLNPFQLAPLSAMLIFNTDTPCKVQYTIKGQMGSPDFTQQDETFSTRHRVAIVGLYENCYNPVTISLLDEKNHIIKSKKIRIKTRELPKIIRNCVELTKSSQPMLGEFKLVSGGYHGGVYAFDAQGNIRFCLTKIPQYYGVYRFESGKFLFPELEMRVPAYGNAHTVITHEMDLLGRVSHTYYDEKGFHHWATEKEPDGNILSLSSSVYDTCMENTVVEIDRSTGKRVWELNVNDLFDDTYKTRNDWAHINSVDYIPEENSIIISMRNIHTIAKIDMASKELVWLLSNPKFFEATSVAEKVLQPVGDVKWFFQQHGIKIITNNKKEGEHKLQIMLFDNHTANRRPVPWFDKKKESNVIFYTIDEEKRTVTMDNFFPVPLSITRSNSEYAQDKNIATAMCAHIKPPVDGFCGKIMEFDYTTKECLNEFSFRTDFFSAHTITFPVTDLSTPLPKNRKLFRGNLKESTQLSSIPEELSTAAMIPKAISRKLSFMLYGDLLQIKATDHDLEKIYVYNENTILVQDFTDTTQPLDLFKEQKYFVSMHLDNLSNGTYKVAVQYLSQSYLTPYTISINEPLK